MIQASGVIICLGYIIGLLFTAIPWGGFWALLLGVLGAVIFKRQHIARRKPPPKNKNPQHNTKTAPTSLQTKPHSRVWLVAGLVGLLASLYFQSRVPQPGVNDISKLVPAKNGNYQEQLFIVRGEVISIPRMTRNQRGQFWLEATQLDEVKNDHGAAGISKGVTGKLYVTVPLLQTTGLHLDQQIAVTGVLYKPNPSANPGGFNFRSFLQQEGAFAGLSGRRVNILDDEQPKWGLWKVRERIVRSHVRGLGVPNGLIVSAMVLGSKPVDLPYDIRDSFWLAGLAHTLSASGFQTSLILSIVLALAQRRSRITQVTIGCTALIIFLSLTGFLPPVLRAVVMGFAALIGIGLKRKVQQLGSLLVAAVILLLFNPLWIWDLGFQLSFLSTLGLIITVPPLTKMLQWMPLAIAHVIAVPIAAMVWTLPLLIHLNGIVVIYSILANILTSPFISLISIGAMITAPVCLILPEAGGALASVLSIPTQWLIQLVDFFAYLPGNTIAIGGINIGQMLVIYVTIILAWLIPWWQKRWWLSGLIAVSLVLIPGWHTANTLFQVTVLAAGGEPVLVIQNQGKVILINSGDEGTGRFTIVPFLQQQGVNQIDGAIATSNPGNGNDSWLEILQRLPIKVFYDYSPNLKNPAVGIGIQKELLKHKGVYQPLSLGQTVNTGAVVTQLINNQLPILRMQILGENWLLVGNVKTTEVRQLIKNGGIAPPQVLLCPGESLKELLPALQPQVAIASSTTLDQETLSQLSQSQTKLFITGRDGAIQWKPDGKFETFIQTTENKTSVF
ncbi:ComEC/Rec2 family competence protein [Iningainema tapete]|uniref:ComEC/Rec2 family competence protein n=1 Tax=Iningainema tapete BLCC-T55 TaxID=2748662 RepID=A0A8J7C9J1_9CYAN|nr:ComEC/Rec2 family competence protein [Iningainema tapete]MBD2778169.1 ComEC/Rec2 family competence protein [Iningainema tapete BLCC-T55]